MISLPQQKRIKEWIEEVTINNNWDDCDLHIDKIDSEIKNDLASWVNKSLEFFEFAYNQLNNSDLRLVLSIALKGTEVPRDQIIFDVSYFPISELSHTPPSLYLFKKDDPRYTKNLSRTKIYPHEKAEKNWLYSFYEYQDPDDQLFFGWFDLFRPERH